MQLWSRGEEQLCLEEVERGREGGRGLHQHVGGWSAALGGMLCPCTFCAGCHLQATRHLCSGRGCMGKLDKGGRAGGRESGGASRRGGEGKDGKPGGALECMHFRPLRWVTHAHTWALQGFLWRCGEAAMKAGLPVEAEPCWRRLLADTPAGGALWSRRSRAEGNGGEGRGGAVRSWKSQWEGDIEGREEETVRPWKGHGEGRGGSVRC